MNDQIVFYGFRGSHPCEAVFAAADHKGLAYREVELPPALHRAIMRAKFGGTRVPGVRIGDRLVQGTSAIFHALDELRPEPPLFPADPALRERVERAEQWGEGEFQDIGRRLIWAHLSRSPETLRAWAEETAPGFGRTMKLRFGPHIAKVAKFGNRATDENVEADLRALPALLDEVDDLIADGVIGGAEPNAADFQILASVGLWMNMRDIRPAIAGRPCGAAAMRLFPGYDGRVPGGLLPDEWFAELRRSAGGVVTSPA